MYPFILNISKKEKTDKLFLSHLFLFNIFYLLKFVMLNTRPLMLDNILNVFYTSINFILWYLCVNLNIISYIILA